MDFKKSTAILGVAALTASAALSVLPLAQAKAAGQYDGVQLAACNPCNPCAAGKAKANPCAAANPCNPCAVKKPVNPCAAANPCNPCAAKK